MRLQQRALWAMPAVMVVVAVAALIVWLRGDGGAPTTEDTTPEPSPSVAPCPVDPAICEFARRVEYEYREGNPKTLLSPKSPFYPDGGVLDVGIGGWRERPFFPYVVGIGCSIEPNGKVCETAFSLVLTASPEDQQTERIDRVLLGFLRDGDDLPIVTTNRLVGGSFNIVTSGVDSGDCALAGITDGRPCQGVRFFAYTTGSAVARPAPLPTASSTPGVPGPDPLAGIEITQLHAASETPGVGYDTVGYYSTGCFACGRPEIPSLFRTYRDSAGNLRTDDLFGPLLAKTGGYPHDLAADWEHGHLLVLVCTTGYCGGEGDPSPDATLKLFRSRDGGVTFTAESAPGIPVGSFLGDFLGDQVIVGVGERKGLDFTFRRFLYPSNQLLTPPAGLGTANPVPDGAGGAAWVTYSPATGAFDSNGKLIVASGGGRFLVRLQFVVPGWLATWIDPSGVYFGLYDGRGTLVKALSPGHGYADIRGQLPNGLFYGNFELPETYPGGTACKEVQHIYAALMNWNTGDIHPMRDFEDCVEGRHIFVNAILSRPVLRVATGADCLNVRAESNSASKSLGCFADGVLLMRRLEGLPAPVAGWLPIFTPAFEPGWVAEQFVAP